MKKIAVICMLMVGYAHAKDAKQVTFIQHNEQGYPHIQSVEDACFIFPKTVQEIEQRSAYAQKRVLEKIAEIVTCSVERYNKETVLHSIDLLGATILPERNIFHLMKSIHPDASLREAASKEYIVLAQFFMEHIGHNKELYHVVKAYAEGPATHEQLSSDDLYFLKNIIKGFEYNGLNLSAEVQEKVLALRKRSLELGNDFARLIEDTTPLEVKEEELTGIHDDFKKTLKRSGDRFLLPLNYPTEAMVMNYCVVQETRKRYSKKFRNRGYPANEAILQELVTVRHSYATLLGYESFTEYHLALQMIKTPARAWAFEYDLQKRAVPIAKKEFERVASDLPEGVSLTKDGKMQVWDSAFVGTYFKKKYYALDELVFAEYFPMEKTISGLMHIYEKFFNITIEPIVVKDLWHEDVQLLCVKNKEDGSVLGYIFLDMFPREKKYGHAAAWKLVAALKNDKETHTPTVVTVVCNFTKPTPEKPSLLKYNEVVTFFHEFGHALHNVFGATHYYNCSGTAVETDFVELPSQMLENWMKDKDILKMISSHYITGQPLSDDLIETRLELLKFGKGMFVARQIMLGMFSLEVFGSTHTEPLAALWQRLNENNETYLEYDADAHSYCSFGHLAGYGAKYYGYLWSLVLAEDVFEQIEKEGLLNPEAGKKYVDTILGCGGSKDANDMVRNYLGREPRPDAFYRKMGF